MSKNKKAEGIVYSTNPDFEYKSSGEKEGETLPPSKQKLKINIEKLKGGKIATIIKGFIGTSNDLEELGKKLKIRLGTGGTAKNGEIIIQGDFREKIADFLNKNGYNIKN